MKTKPEKKKTQRHCFFSTVVHFFCCCFPFGGGASLLCLQRDPAKVSFTARLFFVLFLCIAVIVSALSFFFFFHRLLMRRSSDVCGTVACCVLRRVQVARHQVIKGGARSYIRSVVVHTIPREDRTHRDGTRHRRRRHTQLQLVHVRPQRLCHVSQRGHVVAAATHRTHVRLAYISIYHRGFTMVIRTDACHVETVPASGS